MGGTSGERERDDRQMNRQRGEGLGCHSTARARWEHKEDFSRSPTSPPLKGREGVLAFQAAWLHGDGRRNLRKKNSCPPPLPRLVEGMLQVGPGGLCLSYRQSSPLTNTQTKYRRSGSRCLPRFSGRQNKRCREDIHFIPRRNWEQAEAVKETTNRYVLFCFLYPAISTVENS